jgi:hypothetical protein
VSILTKRPPEGQRVLAAAEQIAELELRDAGGKPVAFESILVSDLAELAAMGVAHRGVGTVTRRDGGDPVRYVISVTLAKRRGADGVVLRSH